MFCLRNFVDISKNSIIICDNKMILKVLPYSQMLNIAETVYSVLKENICSKNICLGLLMNHNLLIPSIILSIQKLQHSFVFLTLKHFNKTITCLKCCWILSFEDVTELPSFQEICRVELDGNKLILWNREDIIFSNSYLENISCIVHTSGTTGENKLIRVTNTCIETNITSLSNIFNLSSKDIIFWGTKLTFDPSIVELALALQNGACLLIVPYKVFVNTGALYDALFNVAHVTFLQMVPSIFLRWNEDQIKQILLNPYLKILSFGGEHFPKSILAYERSKSLRIFNLYGISEISCWATLHEISTETVNDEIPIGRSLEATVIELRDEFGIVNPRNGEIFIGSSSRICYVNEESPSDINGTVFRETGDLAEVRGNEIYLVGRKNKVVKRFGHRINLTKMENKILAETGFENKCVWSQENSKILTFMLIRNLDIKHKSKILDKLRVKLINILPEESFPDFIEIVTIFPLTCHGKVNEKALERLYYTSETPLSLIDNFRLLWCKYTGITDDAVVELSDNTFFEVGGNSITALQLLTEFKDKIKHEYPQELLTMLFENSYKDCQNCLENFKPSKNITNELENDECPIKKKKVADDKLRVLWCYDLKACVDSSPVVFERGNIVYAAVGSFSYKFVVLQDDGKVVYEVALPNSIECTPSISPCQNFLLVGCLNGTMYCVDFLNKRIVWEFQTGGKIKSSVCFCRDGSAAVFGSYDKMMYCVSLKNGTKLWNASLDGSISSNPIYSNSQKAIFIASTKGTCFCLTEDVGQVIWKKHCEGPIFGTPCIVDINESIIFATVQGVLYCLGTKMGEMVWRYEVCGHIFSSVVLHESKVLFGCHDKSVHVLDISDSKCSLIKRIPLDSETSSAPFVGNISGNDVIVTACNSGTISVIDFNTFEVLTCYRLPHEVFSSPFVYNNRIYVGCRDNNFYCIEFK